MKRRLRGADLFCGLGGFTLGAERAGIDVMLGINHWRQACLSCAENHPNMRVICARIDDVDPRNDKTLPELDILLASPECTHHSIARGGRPIDDQKRATPWHVLAWTEAKRPKWVGVENVREFRDWGPLDDRGRPIKSRKGEIFRQWIRCFEALGYQVDHQLLNAADFGAATSRTRLFITARRGRSRRDIPWPEPTHSRDQWRPAWSIIDWSKPCPSIFTRKRPLAEKTLRRIEMGLRKFVGPFAVTLRRNMAGRDLADPLATITAGAEHHGLAVPFIVNYHGGIDPARDGTERQHGVDTPLPTVDTSNRFGVACPFLVPNFGERDRQSPRTHDPVQPLPAVTSHGAGAVALPFMLDIHNRRRDDTASHAASPVPTIVTKPGNSLVLPFMLDVNHGGHDNRTRGVDRPTVTITTSKGQAVCLPFLTKYYGTAGAVPVTEPLDTLTVRDRFALAGAVVASRDRFPSVRLLSGTDGRAAAQSLIATMWELGVVDIGFRMLAVDELARAQGFPDDYVIFGNKGEQVKQIGNSVPPDLAEALCRTYAEAA